MFTTRSCCQVPHPYVLWTFLEMVITRILSIIRDDLPSLKLSTEMPAELQATKHNLEKACADGSMERFRLNTERAKTVIQSSGDSYPPSSNGCGTEVEIRARAGPCQWGADCRGLTYESLDWDSLLPLVLVFWSSLRGKKKEDPIRAIILYSFAPTQKHVVFPSALPFGILSQKAHNFLPNTNTFKAKNTFLTFSSQSNSTQGCKEKITL